MSYNGHTHTHKKYILYLSVDSAYYLDDLQHAMAGGGWLERRASVRWIKSNHKRNLMIIILDVSCLNF